MARDKNSFRLTFYPMISFDLFFLSLIPYHLTIEGVGNGHIFVDLSQDWSFQLLLRTDANMLCNLFIKVVEFHFLKVIYYGLAFSYFNWRNFLYFGK